MHLSFGMGLFWIIIASTIGETVVRAAKALGRGRGGASLEARLAALELALERQARVIDAHEEAVGRLESHADVTARALAERAGSRAQPDAGDPRTAR